MNCTLLTKTNLIIRTLVEISEENYSKCFLLYDGLNFPSNWCVSAHGFHLKNTQYIGARGDYGFFHYFHSDNKFLIISPFRDYNSNLTYLRYSKQTADEFRSHFIRRHYEFRRIESDVIANRFHSYKCFVF